MLIEITIVTRVISFGNKESEGGVGMQLVYEGWSRSRSTLKAYFKMIWLGFVGN